jgi:LPS sulfotransferase NodH
MAERSARAGYVICTEPRSGSNFLCALLEATGKLGRPREYFSDKRRFLDIERAPGLFEAMLEEATGPDGIYGLKVFSRQFDLTRRSAWPSRLPGLRFVSLERRDLLGQAISWLRATQTGQFRAGAARSGEARYDARAIARLMARFAGDQARWRLYFARNGIEPLWLTYEEVTADPAAAVAAVAAAVGVGGPLAVNVSAIPTSVQRDLESEVWRDRFVAEAGDVNRLEHRLGEPRIRLRRLAHRLAGRR